MIEAACDLRWMPQRPFRYYMLGFRDFVLGGEFEEFSRSDAASCFLRLVLEKLETKPQDIRPIMLELLPAIRYVAENQSLFEAKRSIYGDFPALLRQIEAAFARARHRLEAEPFTLVLHEAFDLFKKIIFCGVYRLPKEPTVAPQQRAGAHLNAVSPGFFATLGIHVIAGRDFDGRDSRPLGEAGYRSAIVNESFAKRYLAGRSPLGARIAQHSGPDVKPNIEVVGVVADFSYQVFARSRNRRTFRFLKTNAPAARFT